MAKRRLMLGEVYRVVRVTDDGALLKQQLPGAASAPDFWAFQGGAEVSVSPPLCESQEVATFNLSQLVREINPEGLGVAPVIARRLGLPEPLVVFIRDDGWSVGAAGDRAERVALEYWGHRYVTFARREEGWKLRPILEYQRGASCA